MTVNIYTVVHCSHRFACVAMREMNQNNRTHTITYPAVYVPAVFTYVQEAHRAVTLLNSFLWFHPLIDIHLYARKNSTWEIIILSGVLIKGNP